MADHTATAAFKNWFGQSAGVDQDAKPRVFYHGSPDAVFDTFAPAQYFAETAEIASIYTRTTASSISIKPKLGFTPAIYAVYLNISRPFDTRIPEVRLLFEREFLNKHGNGTPLSANGLPDWSEAGNLVEWIDEKGMDFDGLILDEGSLPQQDGTVKSRGLSFVPLHGGPQVRPAYVSQEEFDAAHPGLRMDYALVRDPAYANEKSVLADIAELDHDSETFYDDVFKIVEADVKAFAAFRQIVLEMQPWAPNGQTIGAHITDFFADTPGTGGGTAVMQRLERIADAAQIGVHLRPSSDRNCEFYGRFGFAADKRNHGFLLRSPAWDDEDDEREILSSRG